MTLRRIISCPTINPDLYYPLYCKIKKKLFQTSSLFGGPFGRLRVTSRQPPRTVQIDNQTVILSAPTCHSELVEESPRGTALFKRPLDALGVTYNMTLRRIIFCPTINFGLYSLFIVILSLSKNLLGLPLCLWNHSAMRLPYGSPRRARGDKLSIVTVIQSVNPKRHTKSPNITFWMTTRREH